MGIQKASSMHYGLAFLLTTKELMINVKSLELRTRIIEKDSSLIMLRYSELGSRSTWTICIAPILIYVGLPCY